MSNIQQPLGWFFSVGRKFFRIAPINTAWVVLNTIISQISNLLAFFLPLKIIILLATPRIPRYFPQSWADYDRDMLIISLCVATLVFYLLHHLAEKLVAVSTERGGTKLIARSRKIMLFADQDTRAQQAYRRFSAGIAGLVFVLLCMVFLWFVYPLLLAVVIGYGVLFFFLMIAFLHFSRTFEERWDQHASGVMNLFSAVGFFLIFAIVVLHFLYGSPPGFLFVIVSILLTRQFLGRTAAFVTNLKTLYAERLVINALFFQGHVLLKEVNKKQKHYWHLLEEPQRSDWVIAAIQELTGVAVDDCEIHWLPSGVADVAILKVAGYDKDKQLIGSWLLKLFGTSRHDLAMHESTLLTNVSQSSFPTPVFYGAQQVEKCLCHLFQWSELQGSPVGKELKAAVHVARTSLLTLPVPSRLLQQYTSGHQLLWQRLTPDMSTRLLVAVNTSAEKVLVEQFAAVLPRMCRVLAQLPLQLINPDIRPDTLWMEEHKPILTHWGRWKIDPLGTDWPVRPHELKALTELAPEIIAKRPDAVGLTADHLVLSALTSVFERHYLKQNLTDALAIIPDILTTLDSISSDDDSVMS